MELDEENPSMFSEENPITTRRLIQSSETDTRHQKDFETKKDPAATPDSDFSSLEEMHRGVIDDISFYTLILLRAIYDSFDDKGNRVFRSFRLKKLHRLMRPKLINNIEGDLKSIRNFLSNSYGEISTVVIDENLLGVSAEEIVNDSGLKD